MAEANEEENIKCPEQKIGEDPFYKEGRGTFETGTGSCDISIIVTVYNGEQYLPACVESVLAQTYRSWELVLVDDGSGDSSPALCDRYAAAHPNIRVVHQENQGLIMARASGARASRGQYLMFLDSDDTIEPVMLEEMQRHLERDGAKEIVCCNYVIDREWNGTHEERKSAAAPGIYTGERLEKEIRQKLLGEENRTVILSMCMKLFSRELILPNLHYCDPRIRMGEDVCRTVPAILDCERLVLLEDAFYYHYRFVKSSMVHGYDAGMRENMRLVAGVVTTALADRGRQDLFPGLQREEVYLYLLVLKNEIRRRDVGSLAAARHIREICVEDHSREQIARIPTPSDPASRLLATVMRYPAVPVILAVRGIFLLKK